MDINSLIWPKERPRPLNRIFCREVNFHHQHALPLLTWPGTSNGLLVHSNPDTGNKYNNIFRLFITSNEFWFSTNATPNSRQVINHYSFGDIEFNCRFFLNLFLVVFCHDFFGSDKRYPDLIKIILDTLEFYKPYLRSKNRLAVGFVFKEILSALMSYNSNPNEYWIPGIAKHSVIHDFFSSFLLAWPHVRTNEHGDLLRLVDTWPIYTSSHKAHLAFLEPLGKDYPRFGGAVLCAPLIFNSDLSYNDSFSTLFRSGSYNTQVPLTFVKGKVWAPMDPSNYLPDTNFEELPEKHYLLDSSIYGQSGFSIPRFNINGKLVPKIPTMKWQSTSVVVKILKDIHNFYNYEDRAYLHTVLQKRSLTGLKELDILLKDIGFLDDLAIINSYRQYYSLNPQELEDWHTPNIAFTHKLVDNLLLAFLGGVPQSPYNRVISEALHPPRKKSWSFFK